VRAELVCSLLDHIHFGKGTEVIKWAHELCLNYESSLQQGYRLYIGNWYVCPELVDMLDDHETDCFGMVGQTQKGIPDKEIKT
jgi:hypothetical protein